MRNILNVRKVRNLRKVPIKLNLVLRFGTNNDILISKESNFFGDLDKIIKGTLF